MTDSAYIIVGILSIMATLIAAIIAPVITAHINAKKNIKLKAMEIYFKTRNDAYKEFIASTHVMFHILLNNTTDLKPDSFTKPYYSAYLLASDKTREALETLYNLKLDDLKTVDDVHKLLKLVCDSMREELQEEYAQKSNNKKKKRHCNK